MPARFERIVGSASAAGIVGAEDVAAVTPSVATATMAPFSTDLDDVFISVKTTRHYHHSRLPAIIGTWFQFAKEQVCLVAFYSRSFLYIQYNTCIVSCNVVIHMQGLPIHS